MKADGLSLAGGLSAFSAAGRRPETGGMEAGGLAGRENGWLQPGGRMGCPERGPEVTGFVGEFLFCPLVLL